MDKKKLIANWKSHKTAEETILFLDVLKEAWLELNTENKEIIILPSFTALSAAAAYIEIEGLPISLGAQDISMYGQGAYTGEVSGVQIKEFAKYVLINHSERRRYNHEADQEARAKVIEAQKHNLVPLFCIQNESSAIPDTVAEVVYEPPSAISTFEPGAHVSENAEIERVFSVIKNKYPHANVYYGGSVSFDTIGKLGEIPNLSGFLVGSASLTTDQFLQIIQAW